jgi:hypothetical protein
MASAVIGSEGISHKEEVSRSKSSVIQMMDDLGYPGLSKSNDALVPVRVYAMTSYASILCQRRKRLARMHVVAIFAPSFDLCVSRDRKACGREQSAQDKKKKREKIHSIAR